jgi:thiopurine S-methyltransferase
MTIDFWAGRWREGRIGFHEGAPNAFLQRHNGRLGQARRVLVPLCGKAEDLAYLASLGHEVVGIEAVEDAVEAFFAEHELAPEVDRGKLIRRYSAKGITILCGDVFACTAADVGTVSALYDRAALVALPEDVRPKYVRHLRALLAPGSSALVVTFDYPDGAIEGPPFSVTEKELRDLYAGARAIELLEHGPVRSGRLAGANGATEMCFAIAV